MFDDDGSVRAALAAGAAGYVVKDATHSEILAAIEAASHGAIVLGSGVARGLSGAVVERTGHGSVRPHAARARHRGSGGCAVLPNRQIADRLGLAGKTVRNNVSAILAKCGATDRVELSEVIRARRRGGG